MTSPLADDQALLIVPADLDASEDLVRTWAWASLDGVPLVPRLRAAIVIDELVSNASRYGGSLCVLRLSLDHTRRYLLVFVDDTVADDGTAWPVHAGLTLVEGLTSDWAVERRAQGKTVWAEIPLGMRFPGPWARRP